MQERTKRAVQVVLTNRGKSLTDIAKILTSDEELSHPFFTIAQAKRLANNVTRGLLIESQLDSAWRK
jgi:hypothetical protein